MFDFFNLINIFLLTFFLIASNDGLHGCPVETIPMGFFTVHDGVCTETFLCAKGANLYNTILQESLALPLHV